MVPGMASASDIVPVLGLQKLGGVECRFAHDTFRKYREDQEKTILIHIYRYAEYTKSPYQALYRYTFPVRMPRRICTQPARMRYHRQQFKLTKLEVATDLGGCSDSTASAEAGRGRGR